MPSSLVVKNGVNSFCDTSGAIPVPVSVTDLSITGRLLVGFRLANRSPGVSGVEVVSDHDGVRVLKAALGQGGRGQEALKAAFLGGLDVRRFELREPSLHDAFISLTGDNPDIDQSVKAGAAAAR